MKTIYYLKHLTAVIAMLLMVMNVFSQALQPVTTIGPATLAAGTYTVPVTVAAFPATVGNISLIMNYDATKLTYTGITLNTGLVAANAQTTPVSDVSGIIRLSYTSSAAIVLTAVPATTTLFTLTFTVKPGVQGIAVPLTWSVLQGNCDYTVVNTGAAFTPAITPNNQVNYFISGKVAIAPVPTIIGPASTCPATATVYTTEAGKTLYVWTAVGATSITPGINAAANTATVIWPAGVLTPSVSVTYTDAAAGAAVTPTVKTVLVTTLSPTLSGPIAACVGTTNTYTTDAGMTGYLFSVLPIGAATITQVATSNIATVVWNVGGTLSVTYTPPTVCTIVPSTLVVAVNAIPVPTITGPIAACAGSVGNIYTTETLKIGYIWTVAGGTITAGAGTSAITVTWNTAGAQSVSVNYANPTGCTAVAAIAKVVTVNALPMPVIAGPLAACIGSTTNVYSTLAGMASYVWTVSAGGTFIVGATPNTITVTWNTVGAQTVSVNFANATACSAIAATVANVVVNAIPVPTITGPGGILTPLTLGTGITIGQVYTTEPLMAGYVWTVSAAGLITAGQGTSSITVTWTNPTAQQSVSVNYTGPTGCPAGAPTVDLINYYPFAANINAAIIPQFVDPMPHFAAGLRVNAKAGGNLLVKAVPVRQIALSTGTVLATGTIGVTPGVGLGSYQGYAISKDNGATFGPGMWPAQTIEAQQGFPLTVQYRNDLYGMTYANFNILADQTLMMNGYPVNGNILTDPYTGPIPMSVHLHGGEIPSNSDGGPTAWFTPGYAIQGPGFAAQASSLCTYPNQQEGATLWYHPHDQGLTRIDVYCGLAGYYFLRGKNEDGLKLPGWSGDDKVLEVTPAGKTTTFNTLFFGAPTSYLPEIELAIQDRMFNVKGELYWPVQPTNPDSHPFWTPEFFGDVMTVNGKSWPYLSVAPRKYMFRMLDGCNARFLSLWLMNLANGTNGPKITVISTEGGLLDVPVDILPGQKLFLAPAERPMVIIDFTGLAGQTFTMMNDAPAPYPTGTPVIAGLTDRIMQFVVNGSMVTAASNLAVGTDKSVVPANLRPSVAMTKLTDFKGATTVTPLVKRQLILNEITGAGGPLMVSVNNSHFDAGAIGDKTIFGGPTEYGTEGTTEMWQIINTTVDAHPMHPHLVQWQLVSRQTFNTATYMAAYATAWAGKGVPNFPAGATYPGGAGSPNPYNTLNADQAVGGNPAISTFLTGAVIPARPEEMGWKDSFKALPGQVSTYIVRYAPTELPITATPAQLVFPFDPSIGPGYVWHCHIIDHEDMDMMRPYMISPSSVRFPQITAQTAALSACTSDITTFSVTATSAIPMTYQWQVSTTAVPAFTNIVEGFPSPYTNSLTAALSINPTSLALSTNKYRCIVSNIDGTATTAPAALTVTICTISGTLNYNNTAKDILAGMTVTANGKSAVVQPTTGMYTITGVTSGVQTVTVAPSSTYFVGSVNSTDAGAANFWFSFPVAIANVKFLAGDVNGDNAITAADALAIQQYFVLDQAFARTPWSFWNAAGTVASNTDALRLNPITVTVSGANATLNILGMATGDFNGSLNPLAAKSASVKVQLTYGETRKIGANQEIELPLRVVSSMELGAVSLILNIPSDLVTVKDVYMNGSNEKLSFNVKGNELRIGWNSLTPLNLQTAGDLVVLKLKTTSAFTDGKTIKVKLVADSRNELATGSFKVIPDAVLNTDALIGINDKLGSIALSGYPNPFSNNTTLSYTLPVDANVTVQIYNLLGVVVKNLVKEHQSAGTYTVNLDASNMPQGTYTAILRINDNNKIVERTIKLVVNK